MTNGGAEANFLAAWYLVQPGDEVVVLVPTYMQTHGLVRAFGGVVREWPLVEDRAAGRWRPDLEALASLVGPRTRAIVLCTPNNPTGARLTAAELDAIAAIAARHGCWIVSDEIYRGAELDGVDSPSMWGRGERVIVTSGLSKAYGLPGLRVGWVVVHARGRRGAVDVSRLHHHRPRRARAIGWRRSPSRPSTRTRLLGAHPPGHSREPAGGRGVAGESRRSFLVDRVRRPAPSSTRATRIPINSTALVTRLREEESVLVVPGDQFGMDGYLRLGVGERGGYLMAGLERVRALLDRLPAERRRRGSR